MNVSRKLSVDEKREAARAIVDLVWTHDEKATQDDVIESLLEEFSKLDVRMRCVAKTKSGKRCKNNVKVGNTCRVHTEPI